MARLCNMSFDREIDLICKELKVSEESLQETMLDLIKEDVLNDDLEEKFKNNLELAILNCNEFIDPDIYCEESLSSIMSSSIYDLSDEEDIKNRTKRNQYWLNGDSSSIDNLEALEKEAINYFKNPKHYPLMEDDHKDKYVTGYIGIFDHISEDSSGDIQSIFRSSGDLITLKLEDVERVDLIKESLSNISYSYSDLIQVKFYSPHLREIIGSKNYLADTSKDFEIHSPEYSNILYAIPDSKDAEIDDSIYSHIDKLIKEEIPYGRAGSEVVGKSAYSHWAITKEFYETRLLQIEEESLCDKWSLKAKQNIEKRAEFKEGFSVEIEAIHNLSNGTITISDLMDEGSHAINRILYVTRSKDFKERIDNKAAYFQLVALSKKLRLEDNGALSSMSESVKSRAIELINDINNGCEIEIVEINYQLLSVVFELLWNRSVSISINREYKQTYFQLRSRYLQLKKSTEYCQKMAA